MQASSARSCLQAWRLTGDVRLGISVVCEPEEETALSYARVSDQEELEEEIVFWVHGWMLIVKWR